VKSSRQFGDRFHFRPLALEFPFACIAILPSPPQYRSPTRSPRLSQLWERPSHLRHNRSMQGEGECPNPKLDRSPRSSFIVPASAYPFRRRQSDVGIRLFAPSRSSFIVPASVYPFRRRQSVDRIRFISTVIDRRRVRANAPTKNSIAHSRSSFHSPALRSYPHHLSLDGQLDPRTSPSNIGRGQVISAVIDRPRVRANAQQKTR